jgi:hypothetical protein
VRSPGLRAIARGGRATKMVDTMALEKKVTIARLGKHKAAGGAG